MNDVRYALRQMVKRPGLSATVILMLALGIGATTGIFSLFHAVLVKPLPVPEPSRLVNLKAPGPKWGHLNDNNAGGGDYTFSYPMFRDLQSRQTVFSGIAGHLYFRSNLAYRSRTMAGRGMLVSGNYFDVLGLRPAVGRLIGPQDEPRVGESSVAVLSYEYWQSHFGGDPGVVGQSLTVNGQELTVVGVAPKGFSGTTLGVRPQVFVPLTLRWLMEPTARKDSTDRRSYWLYLFARLRPGISVEQASAGINQLYSGILNEVEAPLNGDMPDNVRKQFRDKRIVLEPGARGEGDLDEHMSTPLELLLGLTAFVLLIACVNVANLLLARGASRAGEMAVRASIGATGTRLMLQLLTEAGLLALAGGLLSVPLAALTLKAILAFVPDRAASGLAVGLNGPAVLFAGAVLVVTALLFGIAPALQVRDTDPATGMKGAAPASTRRYRPRLRTALAVGQVAFSMTLLVVAGLFVKSLLNVAKVDLGMDVDSVVTFRVSPRLNGYAPRRAMNLYDEIERTLASQPGITSAASASVPLITGNSWGNTLSVEGFEGSPGANTNAAYDWVSPAYFQTLSIPVLAGRAFTRADTQASQPVAIVNESFVRKFKLNGDAAIGKRFGLGGDDAKQDVEIIGVVADAKYSSVKGEIPAEYYRPRNQSENLGSLTFYVRSGVEPGALLQLIPRVIRRVDPELPVDDLMTMPAVVRDNVYMDRLIAILSAGFAGLATRPCGSWALRSFGLQRHATEARTRSAAGPRRDTERLA